MEQHDAGLSALPLDDCLPLGGAARTGVDRNKSSLRLRPNHEELKDVAFPEASLFRMGLTTNVVRLCPSEASDLPLPTFYLKSLMGLTVMVAGVSPDTIRPLSLR